MDIRFLYKRKIKKKDISDLISEIVEVPVKITEINDFNNNTKKGIIYAGIRDIKQDPNNYEVEPIVNYEFTFDENQKEIENKEEKEDLNDSKYSENRNQKEIENNEEDDYGFDDLF